MDPMKHTKPKKSKYWRKPLKLPGINFKNNFYVGFEWTYINSQGTTHVTSMTADGWSCTCMGFTHHGKCKHITAVHERMSNDDADIQYAV